MSRVFFFKTFLSRVSLSRARFFSLSRSLFHSLKGFFSCSNFQKKKKKSYALFFAILVWERVWELSDHASLSAWLLLLITAGAVVCSAVLGFEHRLWCRYLCPIGGQNGEREWRRVVVVVVVVSGGGGVVREREKERKEKVSPRKTQKKT